MILLLGGTLESRELFKHLRDKGYCTLLSTFSPYGELLAREIDARVQSGSLDGRKLKTLCQGKNITMIIDATHPYAVNITQTAIDIAGELGVSYLRYERSATFIEEHPLIKIVGDSQEGALLAQGLGENILLTIGSRQLESFRGLIEEKNVYARVLPDLDSVAKCLEIGLKPSNIIAMQGPFSLEFNRLLIKEKKIDVVITKESGSIGGTDNKVAACLELGVPMIIIARPKVPYPRIAYTIQEVESILEEVHNGIYN